MNTNLVKLQADLKNYGLNPADWKVQELKPAQFKIANRKDRQLYFVGKTTKSGLLHKWKQIDLVSF
ncbi:MAG: hypothetical protein IPM97_12350 [Bdellovibrionaceae bacterium]|nr:hypothetical protein [Pseudobdellovibrionaceae bacterium]